MFFKEIDRSDFLKSALERMLPLAAISYQLVF